MIFVFVHFPFLCLFYYFILYSIYYNSIYTSVIYTIIEVMVYKGGDIMNLNEAIDKAVRIKENGGIQPIYIGFSYSDQDNLNKVMKKSIKLIDKLTK